MPIGGIVPTKTYEYDEEESTWRKIKDYPLMKHFNGITQKVDNLYDFYDTLKRVANKNAFFIHGEFIEGVDTDRMIRQSRIKEGSEPTIQDRKLDLFAIDIDDCEMSNIGNTLVDQGIYTIEKFIVGFLPAAFQEADYIYQFSSSFALSSTKLKAHLFFTPKEPIHNEELRKWAQSWNAALGENAIDPSVYKAVQPVYTRLRVCIGADDPIDKEDMIGYVSKGNDILDWKPELIEIKTSDGSEKKLIKLTQEKDFDLSGSISKIMSTENFHEPIRSTALSLLNKNVSPKDVKIFLEEFMKVAKQAIRNDPERMEAWQARFDDIPRAIESAVEIVDMPTSDDVVVWLRGVSNDEVKKNFASKLVNFEGVELKGLIREVDRLINFGPRAISEDIKAAKAEHKVKLLELARKIKSEERKSQDIFEIEITNSTYGSATSSICKILANSAKKPEVYKLGNSLSVIEYAIPKTIRQITSKGALKDDYPSMPVILDISAPVGIIRNRVEKDCVFINDTGKEIVCPDSILNAVPRMYGVDWKPLSGIVEHPFINDRWELVEKTGYDPDTGLYAELHKKLKVKLIDPHKAYEYLKNEVLAEFPFQTNLDLATTIGMFMTAIQRPYVAGDHGMPGYAIVSPKPSSGKTTLAQLLSYSIYNRPVAATGWSDNDEELGKHLLAILREGHSCVLFDNIKKDAAVASNELAKAMTSGTYSRRKLGVNETEEVPSTVLWLFTGNNIVFKGDFATRILPIRIVPNVERPEFRKFARRDIGQWAIDNRKKIISAVLSIIMAGKDIDASKIENSARFKEWDQFVRLPLMKVSGEDLLDVFDQNDFMDDEAIAKGELLEMLYKAFGNQTFFTREIMNLMDGISINGANVAIDSTGIEFKHVITEAFNEKATQNIKTLGRYILGMKDFILRGYMLIRAGSKPMASWQVVKMDETN